MVEDRLTRIVEAVRLRVEEELRVQLQSLTADHERDLQAAREASESEIRESEERWSALVSNVKEATQQQVEAAVSSARAEYDAERQSERGAVTSQASAIRQVLGDLERCSSLTETLNLLASTSAEQSGAGVFLVKGGRLEPWRDADSAGGGLTPEAEALLTAALRKRTTLRRDGMCAVPLMLDGTPVGGMLCPDADTAGLGPDLVASAGAARLAALTASRAVRAERWVRPAWGIDDGGQTPFHRFPSEEKPDAGEADTGLSARRYARLLISEIKLYNEAEVREGRARRDLATRLGPEIARARQVYEARVPSDVPQRAEHFQDELVRTLADGDASLLFG
jgi:hypothetical protein